MMEVVATLQFLIYLNDIQVFLYIFFYYHYLESDQNFFAVNWISLLNLSTKTIEI